MSPPPWALALVAVLAFSASLPCDAARVRTRKELRSMSDTEYSALLQGLSTMMAVSTETGQALYGPKFRTFDSMIVMHAVSVNDPRGDQGHFGPCFMSFHRAWLLALEESLLSIAPDLKALPYLDITLDLKGGKYYNTPQWIFSSKYAGSYNCETKAEKKSGCAVGSGSFAWKVISPFNAEEFNSTAHIYNGSLATGLLRGKFNANPNPYVTRMPYKNVANLKNEPVFSTLFFGNYVNVSDFWANNVTGIAAGLSGWNYTRADYDTCADPVAYPDWVQWHWCADFGTFVQVTSPDDPKMKRFYENFMPPALHSAIHWLTGGQADDLTLGDMFDLNTSPSDPLMFFSHHANLDRSVMNWQAAAQAHKPSMASTSVMWGYPVESPGGLWVPGCYLHDVINSAFPFTNIFTKPPSDPVGYTHFDVLDNTRPGKLYKYAPPPAM